MNSNSLIIGIDEDPSLRIESSAVINLRGVSINLNHYVIYIVFTMQTFKELIVINLLFLIIHKYEAYLNSSFIICMEVSKKKKKEKKLNFLYWFTRFPYSVLVYSS